MGADGHIRIASLKQLEKDIPDTTKEDLYELGLYSGKMLGVPAVWTYTDYAWQTESWVDDDGNIRDDYDIDRHKQIVLWFENNAEEHEVWT